MVEQAQARIPTRVSHEGRGAPGHAPAEPIDPDHPHAAIMTREIERLTRRYHEARMRLEAGDHPAAPAQGRR